MTSSSRIAAFLALVHVHCVWGFAPPSSSVGLRPSSTTCLGLQMQSRDQSAHSMRAKLAATSFNRHAGKRAQLSTKVATIPNPIAEKRKKAISEKGMTARFSNTKPVRTIEEAQASMSQKQVQILRVSELSAVLSQYGRTLKKMRLKMNENNSKKNALQAKYEQLELLYSEGKQILSVLKSDYASLAIYSLHEQWREEGRAKAAAALKAAQELRSRQRSVADDMFLQCREILEVAETD